MTNKDEDLSRNRAGEGASERPVHAEIADGCARGPEWLLRSWGGDLEKVTSLYPPDKWEKNRAACWWFESKGAMEAFIESWPRSAVNVMRDKHDPADGDNRKRTIAHVTLKIPDGRLVTLHEDFGYGYGESSARFMYEDGNYSCDCNRRDFIKAETDIDVPGDGCGDTIELIGIEVTYEP